jgi:hypothetical protein
MSDPNSPPFAWNVGEHVSIIGDTGTGKSYVLARGLLPLREYVVVFLTKRDERDTKLWKDAGYHFIREAKGIDDTRYSRFVLQPKYEKQAIEGYRLLERVYRQGRWTVVIDEFLLAERLGLREQIERLFTQGRSDKVSVVVGQQRPVVTSRFAISQSTHIISFRVDGRDAKTLSDATTTRILPYLDEKHSTREIPAVEGHDFAYMHRARRYVGRGNARAFGALLVRPGDLAKSRQKGLDTPGVSATVG